MASRPTKRQNWIRKGSITTLIHNELTSRAGQGTLLASPAGMECYFGSSRLPGDNTAGRSAVVMFTIPELGLKFKAPFDGVNSDHSDLAALLALLEFIDSNQNYFSKHTYQIFGTNLNVVNAVNKRFPAEEIFDHLIKKAEDYRSKYRFSIDWIASQANPVLDPLFD